MALLKFLKGNYANLGNAAISEGQILICNDTAEMFVDVAADKRIKIGDFTVVGTIAELEALDATKVPTSRLYYVENGNILARSTGTAWVQINKQPDIETLKTQLGLGTLAYKSEVAEADLNADLAAKINAASGAQHSHDNKDVIDGITAEKVAAWDAAEGNAKGYADGLNTAMNTRVEALEAIDHEHANKALLDTYTQTEADLADAVAKKHAHTFNETELNKIAEGDVAKWNGVAADHLTSADKTTLEDAIKEAKKAGTDANTNIETYKVTNDARVLAVEEDVAEITDGTNGILAQAKSYSDGKLATARTEISAEIDADVKVVADDLAGYKTTNDAAVAAKVAKADYEADKATFATKTELGNVDAKFADYVTSASYATDKAGIEKAIEDEAKARSDADAGFETRIAALEGNFGDGEGTVESQIAAAVAAEAEARAEAVKGVQDGVDAVAGRMTTAEGKITALEGASATHALKTEVEAVDAKFANYKTAEAQKAIDDEQDRRLGVIEGDYLKAADIADFETKDNVKKVADDLAAYVESNDAALAVVDGKFANYRTSADQDVIDNGHKERIEALEAKFTGDDSVDAKIEAAVAAEKQRAEGIEGGLRTDINTVMGDYLKAADKTALQDQITANANAITTLTDGIDPDKIDGLTDLVNWANEHAPEVQSIKDDIEANAKAIADQATADAATYETKTDASAKLAEAKEYADGVVATEKTAREAADAELSAAIEAAKTEADNQDAVVLAEAEAYADQAKADAIADAAAKYETIGTSQGIVDGLKLAETYEPIGAEGRAIAAAKTETENQVKALADTLYTKDEVDALIATAHTWGEF